MDKQKAFLFDLNGTMIDDMAFHIRAWHTILNSLGAEISMERTKAECYGKNDELLERVFPGRFSIDEKNLMSYDKEKQYQQAYRSMLHLIGGLPAFLDKAKTARIPMAIGSAAIMFNIDFVLDGLDLRDYFGTIVSADDVKDSKPDPETYIKCADLLGVAYADCIVFEDSPKGVEAAANAGMQAVVITTMHTREEFSNPNILFFIDDYSDPQLDRLF
ncbi:HAD family hydrolase [Sediminibacterium soli]|uniref:HAD family hydrolase n=1 Tax=Sediminibacterium soli TaxID=2698829 RepID=UPI00137AC4EA|nr:HAD family phosphatase [Sediminibacterium soli]NCI45731.1 HAD family phosphatase [Sediminibacterium soli]